MLLTLKVKEICVMKELLPVINRWTEAEKPFAMATVIKTWGSSPRPVGSTMLVADDMEMAGSVSGGCVEGAVVRASLPLIEAGAAGILQFGVTDDDAWAVGLSCGGQITVLAERFVAFDARPEEQAVWQALQRRLHHNQPCVLVSRIAAEVPFHALVTPEGDVIGQALAAPLRAQALQAYQQRRHVLVEAAGSEPSHFFQVFPRRSQLLIVGAAHITVDLVTLAQLYDFETVVIDPRGIFSEKTQFTHPPDRLADQYPEDVLPDYPLDAYTYAVVLSHDPKIDDNALHQLLRSEVAYIGALGSKKTHAKRVARLQEAGFSEADISRISAPVGLDIHANTPREIALSIMAEIIQVKNQYR
jgi:xanthine dehydrogenase accessory factor